MELTLTDFIQGICWWLTKPNWPRDFHNEVYYELFDLRHDGLTEVWWDNTVDRLRSWGAIRPMRKSEIQERGLEILPSLETRYRRILAEADREPHFLEFKWQQVVDFYNLLADIKPFRSPVFASKLGHFIFPNLFIVMDNEATGTQEYETFWQSMHEAWSSFRDKSEAKQILLREIENHSAMAVHEQYPFEIKIIELCAIGRRRNLTDDHKKVASTRANSEEKSTMQRKEAIMGPDTDEKLQRDIMVIWSHEKMKAYVYIAHKQFMGKNKEEVRDIWHKGNHGGNQHRIEEFWEIVDASDYEMEVRPLSMKADSDELKKAKKRVMKELRSRGYHLLNKR